MKTILIITVVTALAIAVAGLGSAGTANAAHVEATITASALEVGRVADIEVALDSEGQPVAGTVVTLYVEDSFAGISGDVEIGRATTDANGVAILEYEPRHADVHTLRVTYQAPGESEATVVTSDVVSIEGAQIHQSTSGIQIPGLNVWLIIAVISSVWALLFSVAWRVFAIASAGPAVRGITS